MAAERSPKFASAFASAVGSRAGVASGEKLFMESPDAEARVQASRLHDAVEHGDYQVALDALSFAPELAEQRPLSRALLQELGSHAVLEHRQQHQNDARTLLTLLELDADDADALADVEAAENYADRHISNFLAKPLASEDELRAEVSSVVYSKLAAAASRRLLALGDDGIVLHLLGAERADQLLSDLQSRPQTVADALHFAHWQDLLVAACTPGMAEHNLDSLRERLRGVSDEALRLSLNS